MEATKTTNLKGKDTKLGKHELLKGTSNININYLMIKIMLLTKFSTPTTFDIQE